MKRPILVIFFTCLILYGKGQNNIGGIGQWREHYNNQSVRQIIVSNLLNGQQKIFGATPYQIFSVDNKKNIELIGKSNGLHDVSIACTAWDIEQEQLVVAYNNSNIDIIQDDQVFSINELYISNLYPNKKINAIYILHQWALVSTDFGLIVIDLIKHEIKDTWFPNNNRTLTKTFEVTSTSDNLYAVTENGIWVCPLKNNWIVANQWQNLNQYNGKALKNITQFNNIVYAASLSEIYQLPNTTPYFTISKGQLQKIKVTKEGMYGAIKYIRNGAIEKINADKSSTTIIDTTTLSNPLDFFIDQNDFWVADSNLGLLLKNTKTNWLSMGGPNNSIKGNASVDQKRIIAPFGADATGYSVYDALGWRNLNTFNQLPLPNCGSSAIDPLDGSGWFTTNQGLLHVNFENNTSEIIKPLNLIGNYTDIKCSKDGTIWALLDGQGILQRKNNSWSLLVAPATISMNGMQKMTITQQNQVWVISSRMQGIIVFNPNTTGEKWTTVTTYANNLPSSKVTSIAEDKNGTIWVGTNNGIGLFECGDVINTCKAYLPQIKNTNGFAGLLFQKEIVNCITIDGANRKWIGTNNGSWFLSADGAEIIKRYTVENAPLPNDTINQIIIVPTTGEVFFLTSNQIASYRSTATEGSSTQSQIEVYPNPVAPSYTGPIAIRGLVQNALVKITTLNGQLIYQTRALGGQAIWDGKTQQGNKAASGVYLVFIRDDIGNEKGVGKILITSGQ